MLDRAGVRLGTARSLGEAIPVIVRIGQGGSMSTSRRNESLLSRGEQKFIATLLENIPRTVTPLHLTLFGVTGAAVTFLGFVGCNWSAAFLLLVPIGLFMHWFGDSLDGALARYRRIERPRFGFLIDHTTDLVTQTMMLAGLGLSPYFTMTSALLVLSMYLLFSAFTYIRVVVDHVHQLAYGGLGGTEFRIMLAAWALGAHTLGPSIQLPKIGSYSTLDVVVGVCVAGAFAVFAWNLRQQLERLSGEESAEVIFLFNQDERSSVRRRGSSVQANRSNAAHHRGVAAAL
jgi:archaetidylinositol phosphate synthase